MPGSEEQAVARHSDLSEDEVRAYLRDNGDFLQRNPELLDYLHISHASGSAVSLVEKQASVLRERNVEMRHRLNTLTANARDNDQLYQHTRQLVLALLDADSLSGLYRAFMRAMREDFAVQHASMVLYDSDSGGDCRVASADEARNHVGALLKSNRPMCGALRREEMAWLFPEAHGEGSAALVPLFRGEELGLVAVGSSDPNHYSGAMGTLFLEHIAEVVVRLIPRLDADSA